MAWRRALQVAVAAMLLAVLWHAADGAGAVRRLAAADPRWVAAALAALTAQTVLSALRWRLTAAQLGIALRPGQAVREYYLAQVVNQALPGGVAGDAGRAYRARGQAGLLAAAQAVVFERLAGQIALFAVAALAVAATLAVPAGIAWPGWVAPVLAAALLAAGALVRWHGRLGRHARAFARAVWAPGTRARQVAFSLGTAACNIAAFACAAAAVDAALPPLAALALIPLILTAMLIPLSVAGWGLREGAAAALFPLAGATAAEGLAASVAFGVTFLAASLPGVAVSLLQPAGQGTKTDT